METVVKQCDALVLGAGTSGACAAYCLAREGLKVILVDKRILQKSGASWVNAVPMWMFDRCEISRPPEEELFHLGEMGYSLRNKKFEGKVQVSSPAPSLDMRHLVQRMHRLCHQVGVELMDQFELKKVKCNDVGRPVSAYFEMDDSFPVEKVSIEAKLFVDATGLEGALRELVPKSSKYCPEPKKVDLCSAAQQVRRLKDPAKAREFFATHKVKDNSILSIGSKEGGYSIFNYEPNFEREEMGLLNGTILNPQYPDVIEWIKREIADKPWIGEVIFGGRGVIPIRRPYDRFAFQGLALVGNSACHVFPAHGSGIGSGMVAAKILSEQVKKFNDIGGQEAVDAYQLAFMKEVGATHAAYDVFRIFSQTLGDQEAQKLLRGNLMMPSGVYASVMQKMPRPKLQELAKALIEMFSMPKLSLKVLFCLAKMNLAFLIYQCYPSRSEGLRFKLWQKLARVLYPAAFRY